MRQKVYIIRRNGRHHETQRNVKMARDCLARQVSMSFRMSVLNLASMSRCSSELALEYGIAARSRRKREVRGEGMLGSYFKVQYRGLQQWGFKRPRS